MHPEPLHRLRAVYNSTLTELQSIPPSAVYRQSAESITQHRLNLITQAEAGRQGEDAVVALEQSLEAGAAEELIDAAEAELALVKKMKEWKAWEELVEQPAEDQWQYFDVVSLHSLIWRLGVDVIWVNSHLLLLIRISSRRSVDGRLEDDALVIS